MNPWLKHHWYGTDVKAIVQGKKTVGDAVLTVIQPVNGMQLLIVELTQIGREL